MKLLQALSAAFIAGEIQDSIPHCASMDVVDPTLSSTQGLPGRQSLGGGGPSLGVSGMQLVAFQQELADAAARGFIATSKPYYSRAFLRVLRAGAGPFTYTIPAGQEIQFFGYRIQDAVAGFSPVAGVVAASGLVATPADTNLQVAGSTLSGETVAIQGVSALVQGTSDFELARRALPEASVKISLNGDENSMKLGTLWNLPGIGGLFGSGNSSVVTPPLPDTTAPAPLASNGWPWADNFRRLPEGVVWRPQGQTDGNLVITMKWERAVVVPADAARVAAAGVAAFDPPAEIVLDIMLHLVCIAMRKQSVNL